jgi:hypothetical protein
MQITCFNDKNTWTVGPIDVAAARLRFALGFPETAFYCPKCGKPNNVSKADFQAAMNAGQAPKPAGPAAPAPAHAPSMGYVTGAPAQVTGGAPGPAIASPHHGTVLARSLRVRKGHSKADPVVAGLVKGDKVEIMATWTDGKDTWAQLGPDKWSAVVFNGEALIQLDS